MVENWNKEDFGARLKELREARGMSMMGFGTAIGTSASRIKDWEKGKNAPSAAWIAKISERFDITTDELILGRKPSKKSVTPALANNAEIMFDKMRELILEENGTVEASPLDALYEQLEAEKRERYRSGRGRRLAERELMTILPDLPKKDVLELLELAKIKKRNL